MKKTRPNSDLSIIVDPLMPPEERVRRYLLIQHRKKTDAYLKSLQPPPRQFRVDA